MSLSLSITRLCQSSSLKECSNEYSTYSKYSRWSYLRDTINKTAMFIFGKRQVKSADWFEGQCSGIVTPD